MMNRGYKKTSDNIYVRQKLLAKDRVLHGTDGKGYWGTEARVPVLKTENEY
jgi:hypothetical protein